MTVATTTNKAGPFACNGTVVDFPFTFPVFAVGDLKVYLIDTAAETETLLTYGTHYSITLAGTGGTVTTVSTYPSGKQIVLKRVLAQTQEVDLANQGGWFPETHEEVFDRLTMLIQQLQEILDRSLKQGETGSFDFLGLGKKITSLGNGESTGDAVNLGQLNAASSSAISSAVAQAQAYVNAVISNFLTNSTINGLVYETAVGGDGITIPTPYTFTGGFMTVGGVIMNLKNTADCTLSAGSPTVVTLTSPVAAGTPVLLFIF